MVALLSTAYALPFALMQPILGSIADMIGKVQLMIACLVVIIATCFVSAAATSYGVVLVSRIICGMAMGGIFPVGMAVLADAVAVKERQIAIGCWLAIVFGGNLIGGALAGMIGDLFDWRAVFCRRRGVLHGGVRQRHDQPAARGACATGPDRRTRDSASLSGDLRQSQG
jgi:predicted MFS family arabinose efflux permease